MGTGQRERRASGPEPSVPPEHGGGDLRAQAQPGLERAVSGRGSWERGEEGRVRAERPPARAGALFRAGGVAAPARATLS